MNFVDAPLTVLVVEDNPNDARLIRKHLEGAETAFLPDEIELYHEETLDDGIEQLSDAPVDLLLLDLGLPETEGVETFERVESLTTDLPVVVLTNLRDEETAVDLLQQGAQDYINKGALTRDQLVRSVRYALERQDQKRELRATTEQLEVLTRILRHDIRNDIQVLQGWSEKLAEEVPVEHAADLQRIIETSEHVTELTVNTGRFLEVVTGESDPELERIRIDDVVEDELQKARSAHAGATFEVTDALPAATVPANQMLSSVFRNLLNNAVQHNDGQPCIEVSLTEDDDSVRATVADNGPGVPEDRREQIFGKGEQGLRSEGTGIGLYLVHTLVTEFGGTVRVEDRTDDVTGAVFVVELPVA